jgi:outer membrane biosynthesis protein TonB
MMRFLGFFLSLLLHGGILVLSLLGGFYRSSKPLSLEETMPCTVPLEVTAISEKSMAPISQPKALKPKAKAILEDVLPEKKPEPETTEKKPEPKKEPELPKEELKRKESEPKPQEPQPKEKETPTPDRLEDSLESLIPSLKSMDTPVKEKPKKKIKSEKSFSKPSKKPENRSKARSSQQKQEDFLDVLQDVDQSQSDGPSAQTPITDPRSTSRIGAEQIGDHLSMSVVDRVKRMLEQAWRVPMRAHSDGDLIVVVRIAMNPDGTVQHAKVLHAEGTPQHAAYTIAVESALRAVQSFNNTPLPFPKDQFNQWKTFDFRFIRGKQ